MYTHPLKNQAKSDLILPTWLREANMDEQRHPRFGFNTLGKVTPVSHPGGQNITIIAAMDRDGGIGMKNGMPWHLPPDFKQFKRLTLGSLIIMGHKTWQSIGARPLPKRINIVVTHDIAKFYKELDPQYIESTVAMPSLENALLGVNEDQVFIIGGGMIYREAMEMDIVDDMILTRLEPAFDADVKFPEFEPKAFLEHSYSTHIHNGMRYRYEYWRRIKPESTK